MAVLGRGRAVSTEAPEHRAVVTWEAPGEPVVLTLYGADGEVVAVPLAPKRALTLAQELLTAGVSAVKALPGAPWASDLEVPNVGS